MSPFFADVRIELQRHRESPKQQCRPVYHAQLVREVKHPIFLVQLTMPVVVQVLRLEVPEHQPAKFRQKSRRVSPSFDACTAEMVGHDIVRLFVGDA